MPTALRPTLCLWILAVAVIVSPLLAADAPTTQPGDKISFKRDIAPILIEQCQACHGPEKAKGKYRVDLFGLLLKSGATEVAPVVAGRPSESALYTRLTTDDEDDRMPQKADRLPNSQIAMIRQWIEQGAAFDGPDANSSLGSFAIVPRNPPPPESYPRPIPITALSFTADGKQLIASGYNEATVWDCADAHLITRIKNLPQRILGLSPSPDGKYLAVAGGTPGSRGELRLIQLNEPASNQLLDQASDVMTAVRFSPDGSHLAAGGVDNAIRVYSTLTGQRELRIEQHADWITDLAYSPDGTRLASASRDKSCRVFDSKTGAMESAFLDSVEPVFSVAWSDDGKHIFSAGHDHKIHRWSAGDGKQIAEVAGPEGDLFQLGVAPGILFSAGSDGNVRTYSQDQLAPAHQFPPFGDWAYSIAVSRDKQSIAAGSYDGTVRIWRISDGVELLRFVAAPQLHKP